MEGLFQLKSFSAIMANISVLDIFNNTIAVKTDLRFKEFGGLKHDDVGHCTVLRETGSSSLVHAYSMPMANCSMIFKSTILTKKEWAANSVFRRHANSIFKDRNWH